MQKHVPRGAQEPQQARVHGSARRAHVPRAGNRARIRSRAARHCRQPCGRTRRRSCAPSAPTASPCPLLHVQARTRSGGARHLRGCARPSWAPEASSTPTGVDTRPRPPPPSGVCERPRGASAGPHGATTPINAATSHPLRAQVRSRARLGAPRAAGTERVQYIPWRPLTSSEKRAIKS